MDPTPIREVHMILGGADYRVPVDAVLLYDDAAEVGPLRRSFEALCAEIAPDPAAFDLRHSSGHWRDFGTPPLEFRPCSARFVFVAAPDTPLFGPPSDSRPAEVRRLVNDLVRAGASAFRVEGNALAPTPALKQALRYAGVEHVVRIEPGTAVDFRLFAEEGVRTAEARWDLDYDGVTFRPGPAGDRVGHQFTRGGRYEVAVQAGGYREYLRDRSPAGFDSTVILGSVRVEVEATDPNEALALSEYQYDPEDDPDPDADEGGDSANAESP